MKVTALTSLREPVSRPQPSSLRGGGLPRGGARKRAYVLPCASSANGNGAWDKISIDELEDWKTDGPPTPLLDTVNFPVHIKNFNTSQLTQLCKELRADLIHIVAKT